MADIVASIVNSVRSATGTAPSAASGVPTPEAANKTTLAGNFDAFLRLLTTQLKNQNPLEPLDTNQFTQQLVQFAQVEQIKRFTLIGEEWLPDSEMLTPTSKLKRRGVHTKYAAEIESIYD